MGITSTILGEGDFAASITVEADHPRRALADDVAAALSSVRSRLDAGEPRPVRIWIEAVQDGDDEALAPLALPYRDLLQLRRSLPAAPSGLDTRAFDPDTDADEFIAVNNRAFFWHPEQSGLDRARLDTAMAESWFDPEGFRILELDGRIAGFCWTKIHHDADPIIGEIYVIAVDPDYHGRGLGAPMTLAGLEWLAAKGLTLANLYVEADNAPALATYDRLGFELHSTNRAYSAPPEQPRAG